MIVIRDQQLRLMVLAQLIRELHQGAEERSPPPEGFTEKQVEELRSLSSAELVKLSDDVCTGLQLVNFLQDVPRDLALGRTYLPAEDRACFGVTELAEPNPQLTQLLRYEANRARILLGSGEELGRRLGGRAGRGVAVFARGGLAALEALERADWDIFNGRPRPSRARLALAAIPRRRLRRLAQAGRALPARPSEPTGRRADRKRAGL